MLLTPGFSRVRKARTTHQPFQRLSFGGKPLKRFLDEFVQLHRAKAPVLMGTHLRALKSC